MSARLRAIVENAPDAIAVFDGNGTISLWNRRAELVFGFNREAMVGRRFQSAVTSSVELFERELLALACSRDELSCAKLEMVAHHADGRTFPMEAAMTLIGDEGGTREFCIFMHDITVRRSDEQALRAAYDELEGTISERTSELVSANERLNSEIAERTLAQEALLQSQEQLRELVEHQERIREDERKRIAREIHDELGQHLLVLRIDVSLLKNPRKNAAQIDEKVDAILEQIDTTMKSVRAIINNLRPAVLDLGLVASLEWQARDFQRRNRIACDFSAEDDNLDVDDARATVLFRVLQEALTNVVRHARASEVKVELYSEGMNLMLKVADNGVGMPKARNRKAKSFGLAGIRERIAMLGGEFVIDTGEAGTKLIFAIPLYGMPADAESAMACAPRDSA